MVIAVDFDGTCVTHAYPDIGEDIGAVPVLKKIVKAGHQLILYTMRSGKELLEAIDWFEHYDIPLYGVNTNPLQSAWTKSPKAYAHLYIDDAALGCPLCFNMGICARPWVDWSAVEESLKGKGIIPEVKE